jgi:uncharacterized protein (TIGR03083 family)
MAEDPPTRIAVAPDVQRTAAQAQDAFDRFCEVLRTAGTPERAAVGRWTVHDVAAHVAGGMEINVAMLAGQPSPAATIEGIAVLNDEVVAARRDLDLVHLAARIEETAAAYVAAVRAHADDPEVAWHAGLRLPLSTVVAAALGEALIHGYDVARATGAAWRIPAEAASAVFRGFVPLLPAYVAEDGPGRPARFGVRLRGPDPVAATFDFAGDGLTVRPGAVSGPVDCTVSADPAAFLLVMYGRMNPLRSAVTGRVVAWGRKPWLGLTLPDRFRRP